MTTKLEAAFKKASALPPEIQDMIAEQLLADLEDEHRWDESFAESQDSLDVLAQRALRLHQEGKTVCKGFDEL
jgi:hypothetical protein